MEYEQVVLTQCTTDFCRYFLWVRVGTTFKKTVTVGDERKPTIDRPNIDIWAGGLLLQPA